MSTASKNRGMIEFLKHVEARLNAQSEKATLSAVQSIDDEDQDEDESLESTDRLVALQRLLCEPHVFKVGDLIKWKPGLKNRALPAYGEMAIVTEVFPEPVYDGTKRGRNSGGTNFREPLTIRVAMLVNENLVEFAYDGRRMCPV